MTATPDEQLRVDLAVALSQLDGLRTDVGSVLTQLTSMRSELVPRTEWEQRNRTVDERHQQIGRELGAERADRQRSDDAMRSEFRAELAARRVPWTAVGALILAALAIGVPVIQSLP
jgi:hypothetical protein